MESDSYHEDIVEDALVTLDRKPEIMQSIGPE